MSKKMMGQKLNKHGSRKEGVMTPFMAFFKKVPKSCQISRVFFFHKFSYLDNNRFHQLQKNI
jgi:hypothetical protein